MRNTHVLHWQTFPSLYTTSLSQKTGAAFTTFFVNVPAHTASFSEQIIAISLLVTFLYGGIVWHMFPYFSPAHMSWEGHLSGGIMGILCAFAFVNHGPQRPDPFADENEIEEEDINAL